jgi:hypothetical protein
MKATEDDFDDAWWRSAWDERYAALQASLGPPLTGEMLFLSAGKRSKNAFPADARSHSRRRHIQGC